MTYYNKNTKRKATLQALILEGISVSPELLYSEGWYPIKSEYPIYDEYSQKVLPKDELEFSEDEQIYVQNYIVIPLNEEELANAKERKLEYYKEKRREQRDELLSSTDKMLLADYPLSDKELEEMKQYRQNLRDLPTKDGFPWIDKPVPWPDKPSFMKD